MPKDQYGARLIGVVLAGMTVSLLAACSSDSPNPSSSPSPTATADEHLHGPEATDTPDNDEALDVAAGFLDAYAQRELSAQDWWQGVSPWCYEELAESFRNTNPLDVPFDEVTGDLEPQSADRDDNRIYAVDTDTGVLTIKLAALAGEWKVFAVDFEWSELA